MFGVRHRMFLALLRVNVQLRAPRLCDRSNVQSPGVLILSSASAMELVVNAPTASNETLRPCVRHFIVSML
jgi:hypothetical protein